MKNKNSLSYWAKAIIFFIIYFLFIGLVSIAFYKISYELLFDQDNDKNFFKTVDLALKQPEYAHLLAIHLLTNALFTIVFLWLFRVAFDKKISDLLTVIKVPDFASFLRGSLAGSLLICIPASILWIKGSILLQEVNFPVKSIISFSIIYLCVGFIEETVNRGYILVQLSKSLGKWPGIILSSLLFSLMHLFNDSFSLIPMLNLMLGGILLSIIFLHFNKNLWLVIGVHFAWNFTQGIVLGFNVSGFKSVGILTWESTGERHLTGGHFGLEGSLITLIILFIVTFIFALRSFTPTIKNETTENIKNRV